VNRHWSCLLAALVVATPCLAYKETTHERLSEEALKRSALATAPARLNELGIKSLLDEFPGSDGERRDIRLLLRFGANHEDGPWWKGRFLNHFFDVQHNGRGLTAGATVGEPSPQWIIEGAGQDPDELYSWRTAERHFLDALTGEAEDARIKSWGLLFQTLGHVIHHVQDMAQPEHVRNDAHLPVPGQGWYEEYSQTQGRGVWEPLLAQAGAPVVLSRVDDYWSNSDRTGIADFTSRNFLSEGTNFQVRNGGGLADSDFPDPTVPNPLVHSEETLAALGFPEASALCTALKNDPAVATGLDPAVDCTMQFIAVPVDVDGADGTATELNGRAASLSVFDQYLRAFGKSYSITMGGGNRFVQVDRLFTLNRFNFNSGYRFLIPRAVSYSAGLINHFFRGRMELAEPAEVVNGAITLKIRNASSDGNDFSSETSTPVFWAYYDSLDGTRKRLPVIPSGYLPEPLSPGEIHTLHASMPEDAKLSSGLTIVFDGIVGQERGIAALVADASEPGLIAGALGQPSRLLTRRGSDWHLSPATGLAGGSVDWKGRYLDGRPTRVLSWSGHSSRYFREKDSLPFIAPRIHQGGKVHSTAPDNVLGAAITTDAAGKEWIVAVVYVGTADRVYRRPNVRSDSNALYHPETAPDGWQLLGSYARQADEQPADQSWFFNADGTEAQTMRRYTSGPSTIQRRLKLSLSAGSAQFQDVEIPPLVHTTQVECNGAERTQRSSIRGEIVIAADYAENVERLARLSVEESSEGFARPGSARSTARAAHSLVLSAGSVDHWTWASQHARNEGAATSEEDVTENVPLYMDLRNDFVLLAGSQARTTGNKPANSPNWDYSTAKRNTATVLRDAAIEVIDSGTPVTTTRWHSDFYSEQTCSPHAVTVETRSYRLPFVSPAAQAGASAGTDRNGNIFASMRYADEGGNRRFYNYLTNGDPIELFGVSPETFFGIRVN